MEYVYAAMLLHNAKKTITEEALEKIISAVGITVDKAKAKATVAALNGVDIDKVIKETALASAAAPAASSAGEAKKEEKKAPEEEKKSEEEAAAGLGALFG